MPSSAHQRYISYNENIEKFLRVLRKASDFVSGEKIAEELGVTRAQVFKIVRRLEKLGYKFSRKKGYKLTRSPDVPFPWEIGANSVFFLRTKSTQDETRRLFESAKIGSETWVIASTQTKGRGRLGRAWISPEGNFYGSVVLKTNLPAKDTVKVSLIGGLSVFRTICRYRIREGTPRIKWPNDVWIVFENGKAKKISGCLAEFLGELDRTNYVILGIGVNVKVAPLKDLSICLKDITDQKVSLVDFTRNLIQEFDSIWRRFLRGKWMELKTEIEENMWKGRVSVSYDSHHFEGISAGIDEDGSLLVQREGGTFEKVYYGDVFLKSFI